MFRAIFPATAVAFLASTSLAFSASTALGTVKSLDLQTMILTLTNGRVFHLPAGWTDNELTLDDLVTITYTIKDGEDLATKVLINRNHFGENAE